MGSRKLLLGLTILVLLISLAGSLVLLPEPANAGTWSMQTDPVTDKDYFWATLNGQVTAISAVSTVYTGFVWDNETHGDPGNLAPYNTLYDSSGGGSAYVSDVHNSPFSFSYGPADDSGAFLEANTTYYYRSAVRYGVPNNTWAYGNEENFTTDLNPEGTLDLPGWAEASYLIVTTATPDIAGTLVTLNAEWEWSDPAANAPIETWGFVWDNATHLNPSGWPGGWSDNHPSTCDYANYEEVGTGPLMQSNLVYACNITVPVGTYYVRAVTDITLGGDWDYGPELEFDIDPPVADAMFEVWGEADPPYGVFIAAVPALFKLAVLLGTILAAILVLRGKRPTGLGGGYG